MKDKLIGRLEVLGLFGFFLLLASRAFGQPCASLDVSVSPQSVHPGDMVTVTNRVDNCSKEDELLAVNVNLVDPNGISLTKTEFITTHPSETHSVTMKFGVPTSAPAGDFTVTGRVMTAGTPLDTESEKLQVK